MDLVKDARLIRLHYSGIDGIIVLYCSSVLPDVVFWPFRLLFGYHQAGGRQMIWLLSRNHLHLLDPRSRVRDRENRTYVLGLGDLGVRGVRDAHRGGGHAVIYVQGDGGFRL